MGLAADPDQRWQDLPEAARMQVLARLIVRSVLAGLEAGGE
jgi:hypothetical protein